MQLLGKQSNWDKSGWAPQATQNPATVCFHELWKLVCSALQFACISFGDPVLTLSPLCRWELSTAVCFKWDTAGNLGVRGREGQNSFRNC